MANRKVAKFANKIEEIINGLTDDEVISLATTITGGLLKNKINTREDAFKVILNYSEDIRSLLRRKIFTRDKLLSYLYDKNIPIKLPVTKPEIIEKIVEIWKNEISDFQKEDGDSQSIDSKTEATRESDFYDFSSDDSQSSRLKTETVSNNQQELIVKSTNNTEIEVAEQTDVSCGINEQNTVKLLAEQFSDWFYKLLNQNELSPEHFFPDVILNLTLILNGDSNTTNICNDGAAVTNTLIGIKDQYNLYFNPNLMRDSLKAQMDPHGLVMIIVRGTLHFNNVCVGVFEQLFALARDPSAENNWKIKRTDLHLKNGVNSDGPSMLGNSENLEVYCTEIAK